MLKCRKKPRKKANGRNLNKTQMIVAHVGWSYSKVRSYIDCWLMSLVKPQCGQKRLALADEVLNSVPAMA